MKQIWKMTLLSILKQLKKLQNRVERHLIKAKITPEMKSLILLLQMGLQMIKQMMIKILSGTLLKNMSMSLTQTTRVIKKKNKVEIFKKILHSRIAQIKAFSINLR